MKAKVVKTGEVVDVYHESQHGQTTNIYKESVLVNGRMWDEKELDFNYVIKASEAPEKIYVADATFPDYVDFDGSPINTKRIDEHDIEYVRKDAFIKKALEFLDGCIFDYIDLKHANVDTFMNVDNKRFIDEFRKYMKG